MKNKKVHYFDFTKNNNKYSTNKLNKKAKILSIMTYCQVCKTETTKKIEVNSFHLCDKCHNLTPPEIYLKITEEKKETPKYIDWDADLDHLYYHFWLDDTK